MKVNFRFCPACGARLQPRRIEGRDLPACPACEFIAWRGPKVAVALVATDHEQRVLIIRRGIPPGQGGWALPGGYVDDDEDPAYSAVRECLEETGCQSVVEGLLGMFHVVTEEGGLVVLAYRGRVTGGDPGPTAEAPELAWFAELDLPELVFASHRGALTAWRAARPAMR
ncbi:MAG TPA: NUDIX hydrolase [Candidatus Dormibacteraeota bacterium]